MVSPVTETTTESQSIQTVAPKKEEKQSEAALEFSSLMKTLLKVEKENIVSEEELFAGMVQQRIKETKGDETAEKYKAELDKVAGQMKKADGFVPWEDAAKAALRSIKESGVVTEEEAQKIYSESFAASQLDSNTDTLFDGRGGAGDTTVAFLEMNAALEKAKAQIEAFAKDPSLLKMRDLSEASNSKPAGLVPVASGSGTHPYAGDAAAVTEGDPVDGQGGFVFKPISETRGTLVIVTPNVLTSKIESLAVKTLTGETLEEGTFSGVANGGREHYRFTKPGSAFPKDVVVEIQMKDGSVKKYNIADPTKRYD